MQTVELRPTDFAHHPGEHKIVRLDAIEGFSETPYEGKTLWGVRFASGEVILLTEDAWNRLLSAWKGT